MRIGLSSMLFVLFLGLQLTGYISWPGIWVFAPLWLPITLAIGFMGTIFLVACLCGMKLEVRKNG